MSDHADRIKRGEEVIAHYEGLVDPDPSPTKSEWYATDDWRATAVDLMVDVCHALADDVTGIDVEETLGMVRAHYLAEVAERDRRVAVVRGGDRERVAAYLPTNYHVREVDEEGRVVVVGRDVAGWSLEGYVIPRLASGMMFAEEVTS